MIAAQGVTSDANVSLDSASDRQGVLKNSVYAAAGSGTYSGPKKIDLGVIHSRGSTMTLTRSIAPSKWTDEFETEFDDLVDKKIDEKLDFEGEHRLKELQHFRRNLKSPRSAEEILHEEKTYRRINELLLALSRCAEILK